MYIHIHIWINPDCVLTLIWLPWPQLSRVSSTPTVKSHVDNILKFTVSLNWYFPIDHDYLFLSRLRLNLSPFQGTSFSSGSREAHWLYFVPVCPQPLSIGLHPEVVIWIDFSSNREEEEFFFLKKRTITIHWFHPWCQVPNRDVSTAHPPDNTGESFPTGARSAQTTGEGRCCF